MEPIEKTEIPDVVVVAGPTASGKSAVALHLAERFGGEIVNADSMQVYRFLDIGTAKPTPADRQRVPHHLYDIVAPNERFSAGRYARAAREAATGIVERQKVPIFTGGTGLYLRAFLEGVVATPEVDLGRRRELEDEAKASEEAGDPGRLHRRLAACDPESAARIHPNDRRRTIRALEIQEASGRPASALRDEHHFSERPYRALYLVLDPGRGPLDRRIGERAHAMIEAGLLREVRALLSRGFGPELAPLQAIGYRHLLRVAEGLETLAHAEKEMVRDTRRFARRQRTWFRAVTNAEWFDPGQGDALTDRVERFLGGEA